MVLEQIKKLTFRINTVILIMVVGLAAFFFFCKATFLVWFSIPTALVYVVGRNVWKAEKQVKEISEELNTIDL